MKDERIEQLGPITGRKDEASRSAPVCPSCDASLAGIPVVTVPATAEVVLRSIRPIRVDVEMPGMTCPMCSRSVVLIGDRDIASDVSDALIDAFNGASIAPG